MARACMVVLALASLSLGACRSCGDEGGSGPRKEEKSGPTMPTGMLVPIEASAAGEAGAGAGAGPLRVARHVKSGAWTELQIAGSGDRPERASFEHWRDDSSYVSLEAMTLLHEAFARALPGFDSFLPRLFAPDALTKLAAELTAFEKQSTGDIALTAKELATLATETARKGQSLWVLGP